MKRGNRNSLKGWGAVAVALLLGLPCPLFAAQSQTPSASWQMTSAPIDESNPQKAMLAAEERFKQAEKDFVAAENNEARAALSGGSYNATSPRQHNSYTAPATTATPQAAARPESAAAPKTTPPKQNTQPRQDVQTGTGPTFYGTPETGYAGTWTEPGSGDVVTSIIAPSIPVQTTPVYPMVIEPVIGGSSWSGTSGDSWSSGWQGGNSPGGYPPPQGMGPGYYPPPGGMGPGPYPPSAGMGPGMGMTPPSPNYRPLRPNNPSIWQPGMGPGGQQPAPGPQPAPGWQPGMPPGSGPGMPPGANAPMPPAQGWQPGGATPPMAPGMGPGQPPAGSAGWQPTPPPPPNMPPAPNRPPAGMAPGPTPGYQPPAGGMPGVMRPLPMSPGGVTWGQHPGPGPKPPMGGPGGRF